MDSVVCVKMPIYLPSYLQSLDIRSTARYIKVILILNTQRDFYQSLPLYPPRRLILYVLGCNLMSLNIGQHYITC